MATTFKATSASADRERIEKDLMSDTLPPGDGNEGIVEYSSRRGWWSG
jgi:hypothetical protein